MAHFIALEKVETAPHGVTLHLPMVPGDMTNVSEDEAAILRGLPKQFREVNGWQGPTRNTLLSAPLVTKDAQTAACPDLGGSTEV